jgi:hypothetical protein
MRRTFVVLLAGLLLLVLSGQAALAGNPHFVTATATRTDNTLTATFKEAGLGNEPQVHIVLSATACGLQVSAGRVRCPRVRTVDVCRLRRPGRNPGASAEPDTSAVSAGRPGVRQVLAGRPPIRRGHRRSP